MNGLKIKFQRLFQKARHCLVLCQTGFSRIINICSVSVPILFFSTGSPSLCLVPVNTGSSSGFPKPGVSESTSSSVQTDTGEDVSMVNEDEEEGNKISVRQIDCKDREN